MRIKVLLATTCLVPVMACAPKPETALVAANPRTAPARTITNFDEALRCMDDLFTAQGKKDIFITSAGIPDATGQVAAGTKDMMITSISKMSAKSGAFRFVDYDPTQIDVQALSELNGLNEDFTLPSYYIRGAITQLDNNVLDTQHSAALSTPLADLGVSSQEVVSVISVDLNLGKLQTRQIIPGMSASNSIAVVQTQKGGDAGGVIGKAGLTISVQFNRSEGLHQATRNLVELSAIELLGKLTRVPYWDCLKIEQSNPAFLAEARGWFDSMSAQEKDRFVATNLTRAGYLSGTPDPTSQRSALAKFQAQNDLVANGNLDFNTYYRMLGNTQRGPVQVAVAGPPAGDQTPTPSVPVALSPPPGIALSTGRSDNTFRVNEKLQLRASLSRDGYLYCYYQDDHGNVARIFPNRFQPNAFVKANEPLAVPPGNQFEIKFDSANTTEAVACVDSELELGLKLPQQLKTADLEPLPVKSLDEVIGQYQSLGQVGQAKVPLKIR